MAIKKIEKKEWQPYFDNFSKKYLKDKKPEYVEIRILSKEIGEQPETKWMPLKGLSYDSRSDTFEVQVDGLNRVINHPQEIYVDEEKSGWILSFEVLEKDGTKNIIETR
ncbi:DUF5335 family protein [Gracilimonas tropica]|uniref:DUF5335 family protein n=1 Tax=Gracilimonas tropica TaxID=454600 RepID=UPI00037F74AE|nr:DUF5335 family protein [Gracilimonas tropica]